MTRLLIILVLIFILLSIIRNVAKKIMQNPSVRDIKRKPEPIHDNKSGSLNKEDEISDAKFEELK